MPVKKYDRKDRDNRYGVKWGHWKNPKYKFFQFGKDRDAFMSGLIKKEKEEGFEALKVSTLEAQIIRTCVDLVGSPERVLALCEAEVNRKAVLEIQLTDAIKEYLDEKYNLGRDENYYRAIRNILNRLSTTYPGRVVSDLSAEDARRWILSLNYAPITLKNHATAGKAFMNWSIRRGYARENIFLDVPIPDVIMPEPEILTIDQIKAMFSAAVEHYPDALAYLALSAFAGIRSSACARLNIKNIDFEQRGILIRADAAKNKRRIFIDGHPENLWQWLAFAKKTAPKGFSLSKRLWDRRKEQLAKKTNFRMPHNALRHSFCSYHVALHGDAGKTATLLSHRGNVAILYEHYKGNVARAEAEKYFSICPLRPRRDLQFCLRHF